MSLQKTRGIILHQVKYAETSLIVKVYTESKGLDAFILKGVRKSNAAVRPAWLQHLSLVELVYYDKPGTNLHTVKEIRSFLPFHHIPFDARKRSLAMYMNEVLEKSIKEEEANPDLFSFLVASLEILDLTEENVNNFHLWFCLQLTRFLGFLPSEPDSVRHRWFDLKNGAYLVQPPDHPYVLEYPAGSYFHHFSRPGFREFQQATLGQPMRRMLLAAVEDYFRLHLPGFGTLKSTAVLETVFND